MSHDSPPRRLAPLFLSLLMASACGGGDDDSSQPPDATGPSASCLEAESHSDLEWIQANIFTRSCAGFSACHKGNATSAARLNLEDGNSEGNMVDVLAKSSPADDLGLVLVTPGDPMASYLMVLIDHDSEGGSYSGPLPEDGGTMPYRNPLMCVQKRRAVERWIMQLDDGPADAGPDASAGFGAGR